MSIYSFSDAAEYLGRKADRPLPGRATRLQRREDGSIAVKYQATDVVTYRPDGAIVLQSGGWLTLTTKERINEYTRARVYSVKGIWWLAGRSSSGAIDWQAPAASLYYDGMIIDGDGRPVDPRQPTADEKAIRRQVDQAVKRYIAAYVAKIVAGEIGHPGAGDCFGCSMNPAAGSGPAPSALGPAEFWGIGHYLSHMCIGAEADEELYLVPSLFYNAIVARGYRDPGFIWGVTTTRPDGEMAAGILRAYFRKLKPALVAELTRQADRSAELAGVR